MRLTRAHCRISLHGDARADIGNGPYRGFDLPKIFFLKLLAGRLLQVAPRGLSGFPREQVGPIIRGSPLVPPVRDGCQNLRETCDTQHEKNDSLYSLSLLEHSQEVCQLSRNPTNLAQRARA